MYYEICCISRSVDSNHSIVIKSPVDMGGVWLSVHGGGG